MNLRRAAPLAALVAVASVALRCTREVELLSPPSSTSSGVSATVTSSSTSGGGDASDCALAPDDAPCKTSSDCCSGLCTQGPTATVSCRPTLGCLGYGATCAFASQCCSLACITHGGELTTLQCEDEPECRASGSTCVSNNQCCSGKCESAFCLPSTAACAPAGELCTLDTECCSRSCQKTASLEATRCTLAQGCRPVGEECAANDDCCSGASALDAGGVRRCIALATCSIGPGETCTAQAGDVCASEAECCTGVCRADTDGIKRCAYVGGCSLQCQRCATDAECCSGSCTADADGVRRCTASGGCAQTGELCGPSVDCCPAGSTGTCANDVGNVPPKRCQPTTSGLAEGAACALPSSCSSGFCLPDAQGALTCGSACRPDGARCTWRADCCGPFSDCMSVAGIATCVALIR